MLARFSCVTLLSLETNKNYLCLEVCKMSNSNNEV